ncbi:MAG: beta-CASP ribonuclease aCPSF1, partial [Candidatus Aenigmarchaeota archaeon]|nr:beta-CASP ribonuclease aCPSF1 [Candidatus Aenigmarchaeota archaeon]
LSPIFKRIASRQEREKAWEDKPCVIVSTSGMLNGGPVLQHLHQLAENPNNTLLFVGYQAEGSMGRRIQKGWKEIPVSTENGRTATIELKMRVETIEGLSGHSDKNQLLGFVGHLSSKPDRVICVHGDAQKTDELARNINRIFRIPTDAPKTLESLRLR